MNTQQRMLGIVAQERRHVLAEDSKGLCPYAPKATPCIWSDGSDCISTMEHAQDCPLNSVEDRAAVTQVCKEMRL